MLVTKFGPEPEGPSPHPLLVLLHGLGANEEDLVPMLDGLDRRLQAVFVRAPEPAAGLPGGYQWFPFGDPDLGAIDSALGELEEPLVALTRAEDPEAPVELFLGGFSQGAVIAAAYACRRVTPPLSGLILLSGHLPEAVSVPPLRGLPVFLGHGQDDPVVEYGRGRAMGDRLVAAGARLMRRVYRHGHSVTPQEIADVDQFLKGRLRLSRRLSGGPDPSP